MATALEGDTAFAAAVFEDCFGRGGDFTVVVEEQADGNNGSEGQRTEFKVWSPLLTRWSLVFDKMINSDGFMEHHKAEVVIKDFSSRAVETFLRFLYSGVVKGPLAGLVEVAALADKYQIQRLHELCMQAFKKGLTPEDACELFALADRFKVFDLRTEALEKIWIHAATALKRRPDISPKLLEEILEPGLLCIESDDIQFLLRGWASRKRRVDAEVVEDDFQPVIKRYLHRESEESARIQAAYGVSSGVKTAGTFYQDIFAAAWHNHMQGDGSPFWGWCLSIEFGPNQHSFHEENIQPLEEYVSNQQPFRMKPGWIAWKLPHESVLLTGVSFLMDMPGHVHCQVLCSKDGSSWHLAADTGKSAIKADTALPLNRPSTLVKWFKLQVLEGDFHNNLCVEGISRDDHR